MREDVDVRCHCGKHRRDCDHPKVAENQIEVLVIKTSGEEELTSVAKAELLHSVDKLLTYSTSGKVNLRDSRFM